MDNDNKTYKNPIAEQEHKVVPLPSDAPEFLKGDDWFSAEVDADFLDFTEPYTPPRYTLQRGEVKFANVGDLHIISGKPGNGKTGLMTMLMAAILSGEYGKTRYALKAERPEPIVLYVDTEQGKDDTIALKNRVCVMAGMDYKVAHKNFIVLRLRDTESEIDRWRKILKAIYMVKPTDIFLDGMLDLVKDYNDQVECQPIIRKSMMLATHYDTSLWMVLHENPMVSKLVGTLGSIAQRKVAEIFSVVKIKQCDLKPNEVNPSMPAIYFCVNQEKARGKDVDKWYYQFRAKDSGWGIPEEVEKPESLIDETGNIKEPKTRVNADLDDRQLVQNAISVIKTDRNVSFSALRERIRQKMGIGSGPAGDYIHAAVKFGLLTLADNKYTANPEDLFADGTNDLPF